MNDFILNMRHPDVTSGLCLSCDVCCRFPDQGSFLAPVFTPDEVTDRCKEGRVNLIPFEDGYICPFFTPSSNRCSIYDSRPFDCRLYPFALMKSRDGSEIILGIDTKCPMANGTLPNKEIADYINYLISLIESDDVKKFILKNPLLIGPFQEDVVPLYNLSTMRRYDNPFTILNYPPPQSSLSEGGGNRRGWGKEIPIISSYQKEGLIPLKSEDRELIRKYLALREHYLSGYSFESLFIWEDFFNLFYKIIDNNLCILAEHDGNCFMPVPPLGEDYSREACVESFDVMKRLNPVEAVTRIENVEEESLGYFHSLGFTSYLKDVEYVCLQKDLTLLSGNRFGSKRSACNYFVKHYSYTYLPYESQMRDECLNLYRVWSNERSIKHNAPFFNALLEDSYHAHKAAMTDGLGLTGRVVLVDGSLRAYTFGYRLNNNVFCILFEVADLKIKGLAQFISREFSRELSSYRYINIMDASGLDNLKNVKLSYHPCKAVPSYIIRQ